MPPCFHLVSLSACEQCDRQQTSSAIERMSTSSRWSDGMLHAKKHSEALIYDTLMKCQVKVWGYSFACQALTWSGDLICLPSLKKLLLWWHASSASKFGVFLVAVCQGMITLLVKRNTGHIINPIQRRRKQNVSGTASRDARAQLFLAGSLPAMYALKW